MSAITVGVLAAHEDAKRLAERVTDDLPDLLRERYDSVEWHVEHGEADPADPAADERELIDAARRIALDQGWDVAIGLTDLPLSVRRNPARAHASIQHGVGLVSIPALGVVHREERLRATALSLVERLVCHDGRAQPADAADDETARSAGTSRFIGLVLREDFQLLLGMVRANHPTRAAAHMSHAALGALGTAAYAVTSSNIWSLADGMSAPRLVALLLISVTLTTVALIVAHGLWEHSSAPSARERVVLFNLATSVTLALATAALYAALFVIALLAAAVFIPPSALEENIGHAVGIGDYVQLSWLVASIATLGGALGSLIDSDDGVRNAAYHRRPCDG
jgi:hypothetical protein